MYVCINNEILERGLRAGECVATWALRNALAGSIWCARGSIGVLEWPARLARAPGSSDLARPGGSIWPRFGGRKRPDSPWLAASSALARPGWLDLAALSALARPGWFDLAALSALARLGWLDLAAPGALACLGWLDLAGLRVLARPGCLDLAALNALACPTLLDLLS